MKVGDVARLDLDREARTGIPEVVLAEGKLDSHLSAIAREMAVAKGRILVSRLAPERLPLLSSSGLVVEFHEAARLAVVSSGPARRAPTGGRVAIVTGGTADVPVADEARVVAEELGCAVDAIHDVGVAGIHRLFAEIDRVRAADAVVVAAGREGALAPVVAGLVDAPVIGVPVSTGYGHGGRGEAALSTMLQSCAPLTVVNIDAGLVAGACAAQIANRVAAARNLPDPAQMTSAALKDAPPRRAPHGKV